MPKRVDTASHTRADTPGFLDDTSQVSALIRAFDWASTPIGPIDSWPQSLKTITSFIMRSPTALVLLWGPQGVMIYNDAYSIFAGDRHPSLLGSNVLEGWPEAAELNAKVMRVGLAGGTLSYTDLELELNRTGQMATAWLDLDYSPVIDESGNPAGVMAVVVETTNRVLAERRMAGERERQERHFSQMPGFVAILSGPDHVFDYVNQAYIAVSGPRDFVGRPVREVYPELEGQGFFELLDGVFASGERYVTRAMPIRLTGEDSERHLDFVYEPVRDDDGNVTGVFVGGYDVTEAERAQRALEASRERYRALAELSDELRDLSDPAQIGYAAARLLGGLLQASRVGYGTIDEATDSLHVELDWNAPGVETLAGVVPLRDYGTFIDGLKRGEFTRIDDVRLDPRTAMAAGALEARSARSFVNVPIIEQGRLVAVLYVNDARVRHWTPDELTLIQEVAGRTRTTVERAAAEAEVRANEENFRTLARAMPNQVWTSPPDGQLDWFNEQVYAFSGAERGSLDGSGWAEMVHPDDVGNAAERWAQALVDGAFYETEFRLRRHDGAWRWHIARAVSVKGDRGEVVRWIGTNTDIQDQKETAEALSQLNATLEERVAERTAELMAAQDALRQAQKMEAVGQLTGGIAHDFNNLLTGIAGSLELLQKRINDGRSDGVARYIDIAQTATRRAASLTQRLLAFSRRQTLDPKAIDINRLVAGMEDLIRRTVGPGIEVEVVGAGGLWVTRVDVSQLENSLLNLAINARDAMPEGGRITVETANKWLDQRAARERDLSPGQYVSLCVTDTGTGMPREVIERAFDPFFTTKPIGQGTGLGLSMIHGFVRQSGGQVRIYSEVGKGTTMCLYFPRFVGTVEAVEIEPADEDIASSQGETVLVIDDEEAIRSLIADVLEEAGYRVLEAPDGPAGLLILQSDTRIDLLITDVGLPGGLNGRQVADAARATRPELKVLFVTGYAENAVVGNGHLDAGMEVMTKPFAVAALSTRVRDMIEG